jgi:hypothetical protein
MIVVVNRSSRPDAEIENIIPALQMQVSHDFAPLWGIDTTISFVGRHHPIPAGEWPLRILDHTDVAGAGGYHVDLHGRVSGKVFWLDAIEAGEQPSVDVSHELLEMLADPSAGTDLATYINLQGRYTGLQCLREVSDAVESDALGYTHPGADGKPVLLSDFVTPRYFGKENPGGVTLYDFQGRLHEPAPGLLQGGYLGIYNPKTGRWTQVSDFDPIAGQSRRALRHGRNAWCMAQGTKLGVGAAQP